MWPFKKKSEADVLRAQYDALMKESFDLSTRDRAASDKKRAEAEAVMDALVRLQSGQ
jgi:hypothetical protein